MNLLPATFTADACTMKRIVLHWTGGAYTASELDRAHYHLLIEGDGTLVPGVHRIACNGAPAREPRASHTRNCNTGSIGVAVCCMAGATERPFSAGRFPMTQLQWETMARVVAELCARFDISVGTTTVLGHGEVQSVLSIPQRGKWDPLVLPWAPNVPRQEVMERFRSRVRQHLAPLPSLLEVTSPQLAEVPSPSNITSANDARQLAS